jgi:predicted kinase
MNSVFIGGIPNAGKSTLAKKLAKEFGMNHIDLDLFREQIWQNPELRYWEDFFSNMDELQYWNETSMEDHWENIKKQSEAFWVVFLQEIRNKMKNGPVVFEAVNVLPHLAKQEGFNGVYLIASSIDEIYERNKVRPRWGETDDLWKIEAEKFYQEGEFYKKEAEALGYKVFTNPVEAQEELEKLIIS